MNTEEFLDILEQRDLVPPAIVADIREKVQQGNHRITAKSVLKFLVKREVITRRQAKQLLDTTLTVGSNAESSILGFFPAPKFLTETPDSPEPATIESIDEDIPTLSPIETSADEDADTGASGWTIQAEEPQDESGSFIAESMPATSSPTAGESFVSASAIIEEAKEPKKPKKKKAKKKSEWDSPLLLLGGGGLIILLVTGVVFTFLISRENSDAILAEAGEFFDAGSYTQAINQYEKFVEDFPRHPQFSTAKVRLGMAQLWKATSGVSKYEDALKTAQEVLQELEDEPDFQSGQRDLASLLPKIAQGLANQAESEESSEAVVALLGQTEIALSLCANTKYIPKTFRDDVVLEGIQATVARVERGQLQKSQLGAALIEIQSAIDKSDTASAYRIHRNLLESSPGLLNDETLAAKVKEISAAEKLEVHYVAEAKAAETSPRPSQVVAEFAFAQRRGSPATSTADASVVVRIDGAAYGLNARDGALLWRSFVGFGSDLAPLQLANRDVVVVDTTNHELLRLTGDAGKLVWRQDFEGPILQPVVAEGRLLVAESTGKLHVVDAESGERTGYVAFGQGLAVPPAVSKDATNIYVVGNQSSLFTLSGKDFSCQGVFYLGHEYGSIAVPPTTSLDKVLVAVNTGIQTSQFYVLATNPAGHLTEVATVRRQNGLVNTDLLVEGRRVVVLTSSGQISVYEVGAGSGDGALTQLASRDEESGLPVARFGALEDGHLWVAGPRLNKLEILPTGNRLPVMNIDQDYLGDSFDHRLQQVGGILVHVRRPAGKAGAIVAAMDRKAGQALWETELGVPSAGAAVVDPGGKRMVTATASGTVYLLNRDALSRRVQDEATSPPTGNSTGQSYSYSVDLAEGRMALASAEAAKLLHYLPDASNSPLQEIPIPGPVSGSPVIWGEGFVVPTNVGQVYLFDSISGEALGSPFQPPLVPGRTYQWLTPAVIGEGDSSRLLLSDGVESIYLVARLASPQPHLEAEAVSEVGPDALVTRLAATSDFVCAGTSSGRLARYELPNLQAMPAVELGAQVEWGPYAAEEQIFFATDADEMVCIDSQGQFAWRQPLPHGQPTGKPLADDGAFFVSWRTGGLSRLALEDGTESEYVQLDQPVVAGPVAFGRRAVLTAFDGTLLIVDLP
ncbi:MAG: PQQ-binding-like beta-propeller repeat protein [Planctomycetales bacterium]|nr:PQQ-binding-like beta-propeller repeat protein [Planctomycetales bacterium]